MAAEQMEMLDVYSDRLVGVAFSRHSTSVERLEELDTISQYLGNLVIESQTSKPEYLPQGLRAATFLACLPSLKTVAESRPHNQSIAVEVTDNIHELSSTVLNSLEFTPSAIKARSNKHTYNEWVGQLSEFGVFGVLWWGIAHGLRTETASALPTGRRHDRNRFKVEGLNLSADIILRQDYRSSRKQLIQVKTGSSKERESYHPTVAFAALSQLMEGGYASPRSLLSCLVRYDNVRLGNIHRRLDAILRETEMARKGHEQPAAHTHSSD